MTADQARQTDVPLLASSPAFESWLLENQCSLAISAFDTNRLFFVGLTVQGQLWAHERHLDACRAIWVRANQLYVSTLYQVWSFQNVLPKNTVYKSNGSDRLYCPRMSFVTGALNVHEIDIDQRGRPLMVNTQYSCLAVPDMHASFRPVWKPDFITELAPEDRCHLNGLALENGQAAYVTARGRSNTAHGWKEFQATGGLLISVQQNEIVSDQLSMPHSPRCHDGKIWVLNAGSCELGTVDPASGKFDPVCYCPGYARGMTMFGHYAVIGLSLPRNDDGFKGLPLESVFAERNDQPKCGLMVVDLRSGKMVHWMVFQHTVREVANVAVIPGVRQPSMIGFKNENEAAGFITLPTRPAS